MCFSENVSYGAGALLITTGVITTFGNKEKQQRMIAAIPLIFGLQQISEGIVWQTTGQEMTSSIHQIGIFLFLTAALVIWPTWLPWSLYLIEKNKQRKTILQLISLMGTGVSLLAISVLISVDVQAYPIGHSLVYAFPNLQRSWPASIDFLLYDTPTILPFFISSLRTVKKAGYLVLVSMIIAQTINREATTSIWCFFAALISFYIAANVLWLQKGELR